MNKGLTGSRKCDVIEKRKIMLTVRKEKKNEVIGFLAIFEKS